MTLKIHAFPLSPRAFKVLALAHHLELDYEFCFCDLFKGAAATPAFAALNPNKKMPVLEDGDFVLWKSNAIIQYLADTVTDRGLAPRTAREKAEVARWLFWESTTWDPACASLIFERLVKVLVAGGEPDPAEVEKALAKINSAAAILNAHLSDRRFVLGDALSLPDFALGAALTAPPQAGLPVENYPHIANWVARLEALPAWKRTRAMQAPPAA